MIKFCCLLFIMTLIYIVIESCTAFSNFYNVKKSTFYSESPRLQFNGNKKKLPVNLFRRIAKALAINRNWKLQYETLKVPDDMSVTCKGECATVEMCSSSTQRAASVAEANGSEPQSSESESSSSRKPGPTRKTCSSRQPCKKSLRSVTNKDHRVVITMNKRKCSSTTVMRHRPSETRT